ncbi:hypothetical protein KY347_03100 [Candidatus Woesearchaeota archaeon]|nr:hypothetical protein [Candidatus Woesearchaeota archaeon]
MKKSFRKSQAAMEFLMTYGWAILVVLVAIGALAYFGVLSPDRFLPSKCQLPSGVACTDFKVDGTADTISVVLRNGMGFDATDVTVAVSGCTSPAAITLPNGDQQTFIATACGLSSGTKFSGDVNVSYTNADTSLSHIAQGTLTGRVE